MAADTFSRSLATDSEGFLRLCGEVSEFLSAKIGVNLRLVLNKRNVFLRKSAVKYLLLVLATS